MRDSVSVVIPTYNYGRFITAAINSVLAQTSRPSEIIVVDDGSTDNTTEIVSNFGDRVKYVRQENAGVCAARNRGVAESKADHIAFIDADDVWQPTFLEKMLERFSKDDTVGLVHCGMREFDHVTGRTLRTHVGEKGSLERLLLWESVNVTGSVIAVSRKAFDEAGGFDPKMKVGEDWDFCYRVAQKFTIEFVPEVLVDYRSHGAAAHRDVAEMERGMLRFYEKAFQTKDESILKLRRRAYGNFHKVMAGSYFHSGEYAQFSRHAVRSIFMHWRNLGYFLQFPLRRFFSSSDQFAAPDSDAK